VAAEIIEESASEPKAEMMKQQQQELQVLQQQE